MNLGFFIIGGVIFAAYMYFTMWNIFYSSKKQREENYPTVNRVDDMDMDGMGNFSRFPIEKRELTARKNKNKKRKTRV